MIDCIYNDREKWCFNPDVTKPLFRKKRCCIYHGKLCKKQVMIERLFPSSPLTTLADLYAEMARAICEAFAVPPMMLRYTSILWWSPLNNTKKGWG